MDHLYQKLPLQVKTTVLSFLLSVLFIADIRGQANDLKEILAVANAGYREYLEKIPEGQESRYGFNSRDEFAIARLGKPYETLTLSKDFFIASVLADTNYLISLGEWKIAITVKEEFRTLLTVAKMNSKWEVVGIGGAGLAKELDEFEKKYSSAKQTGRILKVYQITGDFIITTSDTMDSVLNVYPLSYAKSALGNNQHLPAFYPLSAALAAIKNQLDHK